MSLVFWDHYVDVDDLNRQVLAFYDNHDERQEIVGIIDELVHQRLLNSVFNNLDGAHHTEFLEIFSTNPNSEHLETFLQTRIKSDLGALIKLEIEKIKREIASLFRLS